MTGHCAATFRGLLGMMVVLPPSTTNACTVNHGQALTDNSVTAGWGALSDHSAHR
ncbi:hypothetical protein [Mesorhizobium sp. M0488]|uniref:hypothetical protein n=1 Tax=unclassified Mesorhizobium TaxID=325217 RepID=UPI003334ED68